MRDRGYERERGLSEDAFRCFMGTEIETLAVGNCFLRKERQNRR